MEEKLNAPTCERGNDLVAFLYGEIDQREVPEFELHLQSCVECKRELRAFREIRESIVAWRDESLALALSPSVEINQGADSGARRPLIRKPSAVAAISQFFDLSPLWMKGAVAFASVLFCVLAVLAVARTFEGPIDDRRYTESEVAKKVDEAVKLKLRNLPANPEGPAAPPNVVNINQPPNERKPPGRSSEVAKHSPRAQRPLTKSEREQLASDLRLISPKNETDLDLLGDRINQ